LIQAGQVGNDTAAITLFSAAAGMDRIQKPGIPISAWIGGGSIARLVVGLIAAAFL
jgi:hypothetical protein